MLIINQIMIRLWRFVVFALLLLLAQSTNAQLFEGRIVDQLRNPIEGAHAINTTSGQHAHSNANGFARLKVKQGDTLSFSHIGFERKQVVITPDTELSNQVIFLQDAELQLEQVIISNQTYSTNQISRIDLDVFPVQNSQEVLRSVPGLIIGQHAGGGKAEQLFLRGFDIDHGTDIKLTVDGMPVNMVSHAHGQGYADLHFLIPETIDKIDFGKGPYYAQHGNFNTAGYVDFKTKEQLDNSLVQLEYGSFNTFRLLGMFNLLEKVQKHDLYWVGEYNASDGPFDSPQNFNRINTLLKYSTSILNDQKFSLTASYFTSKWDASGQIPQRAVDSGLIGRFGAIDDTEGGNTSRINFSGTYTKYLNSNASVKSTFFYSRYQFELYSNFTFFLEDSINGDQIKQLEDRDIFGFQSEFTQNWTKGETTILLNAGVGFRYDDVDDNQLSRTLNRQTLLERLAFGDVDETNPYAFVSSTIGGKKWSLTPGLRIDYFTFNYVDRLDTLYSTQSQQQFIASPKLNFAYIPKSWAQLYVKTGLGFHSNDTRVVVAQSGEEILPYAIGTDVGVNLKPAPKLFLNIAFWYLHLQQEFVYVGDAGIVEPSGKTRRLGVDVSARYQPLKWLFFNVDATYTHARSIEEAVGQDYIPLAPIWTTAGGVSIESKFGLTAAWRFRYIADRPANEDNSINAPGYFVADMNINYAIKRFVFGISINNLFNTEWNETQFATESRLGIETEPVEEIHFTPGTPFFVKGSLGIRF